MTKESLALAKEEKFKKYPDSFICVDDVIMASIRTENGISTLHGACQRIEMEIALTRLQYKTFNIMMSMDMQNAERAAKKAESDIVVVGEHNGAPLMRRSGRK